MPALALALALAHGSLALALAPRCQSRRRLKVLCRPVATAQRTLLVAVTHTVLQTACVARAHDTIARSSSANCQLLEELGVSCV